MGENEVELKALEALKPVVRQPREDIFFHFHRFLELNGIRHVGELKTGVQLRGLNYTKIEHRDYAINLARRFIALHGIDTHVESVGPTLGKTERVPLILFHKI
ncbi:MAG: hypothetical protein ABIG96_06340 [Candidatus Micrarchaeota archaeon]